MNSITEGFAGFGDLPRMVVVVITTTQVEAGIRYKGTLRYQQQTIEYEIVFNTPLREIHTVATGSQKALREIVPITIHRDGTNIELDTEMYGFLFLLIGKYLYDFYFGEQNGLTGVKAIQYPLSEELQPLLEHLFDCKCED